MTREQNSSKDREVLASRFAIFEIYLGNSMNRNRANRVQVNLPEEISASLCTISERESRPVQLLIEEAIRNFVVFYNSYYMPSEEDTKE